MARIFTPAVSLPHDSRNLFAQKYASFPWLEDSQAAAGSPEQVTPWWMQVETLRNGLDAQPGAHDRGLLPRQAFTPSLDRKQMVWDTLVDADLASNTQGWQWAAVAERTPLLLRIFNPITQGEKFDAGRVCQALDPMPRKPSFQVDLQALGSSAALLSEHGIELDKDTPTHASIIRSPAIEPLPWPP